MANDDSVSTNEEEPVIITVLKNDSDEEGDTLTTSALVGSPDNGVATLNSADGTFEYTPNANFLGLDSFVYSIVDGNGGSATATGEYHPYRCLHNVSVIAAHWRYKFSSYTLTTLLLLYPFNCKISYHKRELIWQQPTCGQ